MNREQIRREIAAWMEHMTYWESKLETAKRYDDFGGKETALEMIRYSQHKIDGLERKMFRKGA